MCYPDDADTAKLSVKYQENTVRLELFTVQNGHISGPYFRNINEVRGKGKWPAESRRCSWRGIFLIE